MSATFVNPIDLVAVAKEFARAVHELCRDAKVRLFGSSAAGTSTPESDIDIFVEIPDDVSDGDVTDVVYDLAWEIGLAHGVTLQVVLFHSSEILDTPRRSSPFITAVHREGVPL